MIGHRTLGSGARRALVLNDWICDTSTWDAAAPYLDEDAFTWAFADLRGYGRSRGQRGDFTLTEAAGDVLALADALGWRRFSVVGHSMSTLVALHLAQHAPERVERTVLVTPAPPGGFGADEARLASIRAIGRGDDESRREWLRARLGDRTSDGWVRFKAARWRACADPEAVATYAAMFARDGLTEPNAPVRGPLLAITGERDIEPMRQRAVTQFLTPLCANVVVAPLADCGHYPMQEAPPLFAGIVERFLAE